MDPAVGFRQAGRPIVDNSTGEGVAGSGVSDVNKNSLRNG